MNNQEFKIGQRVKVYEGWNVDMEDEYVGRECVVIEAQPEFESSPRLMVEYDNGLKLWVYAFKSDNRGFKVEIAE